MKLPLFRLTLRQYAPLWAGFVAILVFYQIIIAMLFDPASMQSMQTLLSFFPEGMMSAFGFDLTAATLTGFLVTFFFGVLLNIFGLAYMAIVSGGLIAKRVEDGSMAYLLTTPTSRARVFQTQLVFLLGSMALMFALSCGITALILHVSRPGQLDMAGYFRTVLYFGVLNLMMATLCMLFSTLFTTFRGAAGTSAGVGFGLILLQMVGNTSANLATLKKLTPYGWLDPMAALQGGEAMFSTGAVLLALLAVCASGAYILFTRKQLSI